MLPASAGLQLELERLKLLIERKDFELEQMRERVAELKTREQQANEERLRIFGLLEQQTRLLAAPVPAKVPARPKPKTLAMAPAKPATARKTPAAKAKPEAAKKPTAVQKAPARSKTIAKPVAKATRKRA